MRCEVFENLLSLDNGVNLKGELKKRFEEHREICPNCSQLQSSLHSLDESLLNMKLDSLAARPDFEERVMVRIQNAKKPYLGMALSCAFTAFAFFLLVWYGFKISYSDVISGLDFLSFLVSNVMPSSSLSIPPMILRTLFVGGFFTWVCAMAFALRFVLEESQLWLPKGKLRT